MSCHGSSLLPPSLLASPKQDDFITIEGVWDHPTAPLPPPPPELRIAREQHTEYKLRYQAQSAWVWILTSPRTRHCFGLSTQVSHPENGKNHGTFLMRLSREWNQMIAQRSSLTGSCYYHHWACHCCGGTHGKSVRIDTEGQHSNWYFSDPTNTLAIYTKQFPSLSLDIPTDQQKINGPRSGHANVPGHATLGDQSRKWSQSKWRREWLNVPMW